jgi:hypothetical protein
MKNFNARVQTLPPGDALTNEGDRPLTIAVTEGEVMVQHAAEWLAGHVVQLAPVRVVAPASLSLDPAASVVAIGRAKVVIDEAPSFAARIGAFLRGTSLGPALHAG